MLNSCDEDFVAGLAAQLPEGRLIAPEPRFLTEQRGRFLGAAGVVALPRSTEEVAIILRACAAGNVAVVPHGGGTGLVGGQVMPVAEGEPLPLVLSLSKMNRLRGAYPDDNALVVEAGMTLAEVQAAAADIGRLFPLSLASEGTATIGGNLATNAGGTQVLRYGNTRELCLGLEVVMADGTIWNGLKRLRKDNTGYDLRHLMIGSEGSLGIITAASLRLYTPPAHSVVAMLAVNSPLGAQKLLQFFESRVAGLITGFEMISKVGLDFLDEVGPEVARPFPVPADWTVLVELGLPAQMNPEETMASLYAQAEEMGLVEDGVIATSPSQAAALWNIRESIPAANKRIGAISSHDVSLPLGDIPDFITEAKAVFGALGDFRINCFGHLGDGNLHFNLFPAKGRDRKEYDGQRHQLMEKLHDLVHRYGGSISAEHGVGRLKAHEILRYNDPARTAAMAAIKSVLDPKGILNPGAVIAK